MGAVKLFPELGNWIAYRSSVLLSLIITIFAFCSAADSQVFKTKLTDPTFHLPAYPLVFVASYRQAVASGTSGNGGKMGLDVIHSSAPNRGQELWILLPNGQTKKLFPYAGWAAHQNIVDYAIGPTAGIINGTVYGPSISIDGKRVYFTYFHDGINASTGEGSSSFVGWTKGADLYSIDLSQLIQNNNLDPKTLPIFRLTQTTNKYALAMNPGVAQVGASPNQNAGTAYLDAIEMDTVDGRKLVFASDLKRLNNSNKPMTKLNRNYNLFSADLDLTNGVSIKNINQFQYYTTTSALSPSRLRNGISFSYQATTEDSRNWQIQGMNSEGKWYPILGYGWNNELAHLATFCVKNNDGQIPRGDYLVGNIYYNLNNNGFGHIHAVDLAYAGQNTYDTHVDGGYVPRQYKSYKITQGVKEGDFNSAVGKFSSPECGMPDELYMAHVPSPGSDHYQGFGYPAYILRTDLEPHNIGSSPQSYQKVVEATTSDWAAIWPKPVINWNARLTGQSSTPSLNQEYSQPIVDAATTIPGGMPFATVGTSALFNTDVTTPDCSMGVFYDPWNPDTANSDDNVFNNVDNLTTVQSDVPATPPNNNGPWSGWCEQPLEQNVFGVAIYLTSNKASNYDDNALTGTMGGFTTEGPGDATQSHHTKEAKKLLGVYSVIGQSDTSFKAVIPANVPFEFHLIHKKYGLRWADVKSWHSLKARETRNDCGGCHNHRPNEGIDWDGTYASNPAILPADMVNKTTYIDYDVSCNPVTKVDNSPTKTVTVWQDISAGFDTHCGGCHMNTSGNQAAKNAFSYTAAERDLAVDGLVTRLRQRYFLNEDMGALSSPAFWAARGERTDGRNNNRADYQPSYPGTWGFHFSSVHTSIGPRGQGLCDGDPTNQAVASWVYKFGNWIDNHMPVNTGGAKPYDYDRYHPTADIAFVGSECSQPDSIVLGYWDDTGQLANVTAKMLSNDIIAPLSNVANGSTILPINGIALSSNDTTIDVEVIDAAGNRQTYSKSIGRMINECIVSNGGIPTGPTFGSGDDDDDDDTNPTPSPTPPPIPGSDDDDDIGADNPDLNASINLTVSKPNYKAGKYLTFEVNSPELAGKSVILYLSTSTGTAEIPIAESPNGPTLSLGLDCLGKMCKLSKKYLGATLNSAGYAKIRIRIPQNAAAQTIYAQAAGGGDSIYGVSNLVSAVLIKPASGNAPASSDIKSLVAELKALLKDLKKEISKLKKEISKLEEDGKPAVKSNNQLNKLEAKESKSLLDKNTLFFSQKGFKLLK